jgi:hypothetical protein
MNSLLSKHKFSGLLASVALLVLGVAAPKAEAASLYSYVEDFEDGLLNTPGVIASGGSVLSPGPLTDSVQGANPGFGSTGHSYYSNGNRTLRFSFNKAVLGLLPTTAGLTWTDVGFVDGDNAPKFTGKGTVNFRAYDEAGALLTVVTNILGDGKASGETDEDKIFSFTSLLGIAAIEIEMPDSTDWEIDNLTYAAIPTPALLPGLLGLGLSVWRKGKDDKSEQSA